MQPSPDWLTILVNNIINIVNDVGSMTAYPFMFFTFRFTDIYLPAKIKQYQLIYNSDLQ